MKIFKTLEENASEIRNPNGWAVSAARRLAEEGVAPEPKSSKPNQDFRNEPLDKQLRAHIVWLNKEVPLNAPLEYEQVAQPLLSLDTREAGEILRRLEESAKEVRDPNGYVVKAAQRQLNDHRKGGGKSERKREREVPEPPQREARFSGSQWERAPPPRPPPSAEGDKIARRVQWLNQHVKLAAPLDYDRLATSFRSLGYYQSLEVLNNLEENASSVRDPTAYVLTGIRKIEEGAETFSGGGGRQQRPPPSAPALPAPPPAKGGGKSTEDKLRRKVEWLNRKVCRSGEIAADKVLPVLVPLPTQQAFDILKNFEENCEKVRDPTAYVIGTARKAERGETIGTAPVGSKGAPSPAPRGRSGGDRDEHYDRGPRRRYDEPREPRYESREPIGSFGGSRPSRESNASRGEGRLRSQVEWLNDRAGLQQDLDAERVLPQLARVSEKDSLDILQRLEDSASSVRDPTAYVISAIRRVVDGKGKGR